MATELSAVFYFDEQPTPAEPFLELVQAISVHPTWRGEWHGFKVVSRSLREMLKEDKGILATEQLISLVSRAPSFDMPQNRISTTTSIHCWRFLGHENRYEGVPVIVEAIGEQYGGTDPRVRGAASLSLTHAGPFCAVLERDDDWALDVNARVEENLEHLINLLQRCVEILRPRSMKLYSDAGMFLPLNAHVAYFRDASAVLQDLQWMKELWERGLPNYQLPPLQNRRADLPTSVLHEWRTEAQRTQIRERLAAAIPMWPGVSVAGVDALVRSSRFDVLPMAPGFAVLEYPYYVNAFVDRFYLELAENSNKTPKNGH